MKHMKNHHTGRWKGTVPAIISETGKSLYLPVFILSCLGVALVCCLSQGYISRSMRTYTIMELLLFLPRGAMLSDISLSRYEIWGMGIGTWTQLLLPFLLSMGYLYTISAEKQSGFDRILLVRENSRKYCISKMVSAVMGGGIIMTAGYVLFGIFVYARFPAISEYPADSINLYMELNPGFKEAAFVLKRCGRVFLYGMCSNVSAYLVSVFFRDRYILVCLPLMISYIWGQILQKAVSDAMVRGDEKTLKLCGIIKPENILYTGQDANRGLTLLFISILYLAGFVLALHLLRKRGEEFGFE